MLLPVIMAGGTGSRLWPMSRELYPKQFLRLHSTNSMLQETVLRLSDLVVREPVVICNEEHRFLVAEQLRQIDKLSNNIILEPAGRNTAPAIALAALNAIKNGDDPIMLVLAADHVVNDVKAFHRVVEKAIPLASSNSLVTFGIVPTGPETGYGYIQRGDCLSGTEDSYQVRCFVEKPNLTTAQEYISSGEYYWNSGMFMFRAKKYLEELEKFRPDIYQACRDSLKDTPEHADFITVNKEAFALCPDESVDYAVMEKTHEAVVMPLSAGWSDVGSWSALWEVNEKDAQDNALTGDVYLHNTKGCYINTDEKMVAAVGVENLVIVNTKDALLVIDKSQVQDVKKVVEYLKTNKRSEYKHHRDIYRPWGKSDLVVAENRFNVNRVTVNPGGKLSTQMHHHRVEHWIILAGTAQVTMGEKTFFLTENQSTFIPIGSLHTLENPGKIPLEILEVRSGSYLGDDDIIRIKDHYGRN